MSSHAPKRVRTARSGACTYCVKRRERCYIGVKGIPCTTCHRLKLPCDATPPVQAQPRQVVTKKRAASLTFCAENAFASQLQQTELESKMLQVAHNPAVSTTDPLDNYISIIHQMLGPAPADMPVAIDMPDYVTPLPSRLDTADLEYLEAKGALCLPTARFRTELLKAYICWVHPQIPVLDLEPFLETIADNDGSNTISLLLFHAVMFAGSAFVDISHIQTEGYTSRKAARDILFRRAKVLLELDCEDDRLVTVQALLLLIHWNDLRNAEKDASHFIGICLSLAISIGLHRTPDSVAMTPRMQQMWKRTWWSVYNHARLTSEDILTMMTIEDSDEDETCKSRETAMIAMADFRFGVFSPEARSVVDDCEVLRIVEYQKVQALLFIEKTKLCRLSQFSVFSNNVKKLVFEDDDTTPGTIRVCPKLDDFLSTGNIEELHSWYLQLPPAARHSYPMSLNHSVWERSVYMHRTWLQLLYLGSSYAAYCDNLRIMGGGGDDSLVYPFVSGPSDTLTRYIVEITNLFEEIYSLNLSAFLPTPSVALVALALTFHQRSLDMGSLKSQGSNARKLHQCWNIMHQLRETSALADQMVASLSEQGSSETWERLLSAFMLA